MWVGWSILMVCVISYVNSELLGHDPLCSAMVRMNAADQKLAVDTHNYYRSLNAQLQGIADSVKLVWCKQLANLAQLTADTCLFQHSFYLRKVIFTEAKGEVLFTSQRPKVSVNSRYYGHLIDWGKLDCTSCRRRRMGQNLYFSANPNLDLNHTVRSWYDEVAFYNQSTTKCKPGEMCAHYTQLVWSPIGEVGCASNFCPVLNGHSGNQTNAWLVVCNYSPPGNFMWRGSVLPYGIPGTPCALCAKALLNIMFNSNNPQLYITGFKCEGSLCAICEPTTQTGCQCVSAAKCQNGGVWDAATCRCRCLAGPLGFWGINCQHSCTCADTKSPWFCQRTLDFGYCNMTRYARQVQRRCPLTCNKCLTVDPQQCGTASG